MQTILSEWILVDHKLCLESQFTIPALFEESLAEKKTTTALSYYDHPDQLGKSSSTATESFRKCNGTLHSHAPDLVRVISIKAGYQAAPPQ